MTLIVVLAVVGGFLYATAPDPGQLVLSWVFLGVGGVQLLRGLGRWAKAVVSLAALPDPGPAPAVSLLALAAQTG